MIGYLLLNFSWQEQRHVLFKVTLRSRPFQITLYSRACNISLFNPARSGPGLWNNLYFLSSECSFCISTSLPMQFVQKRAQRLRISFLDARLSHGRPRFQWTLSRNLPTTGFYDSVDSGRIRHCSRFLFAVYPRVRVWLCE